MENTGLICKLLKVRWASYDVIEAGLTALCVLKARTDFNALSFPVIKAEN